MRVLLDTIDEWAQKYFGDIDRQYKIKPGKVFTCILLLSAEEFIDVGKLDEFLTGVRSQLGRRDININLSVVPVSKDKAMLSLHFSPLKQQ